MTLDEELQKQLKECKRLNQIDFCNVNPIFPIFIVQKCIKMYNNGEKRKIDVKRCTS